MAGRIKLNKMVPEVKTPKSKLYAGKSKEFFETQKGAKQNLQQIVKNQEPPIERDGFHAIG